MPEQKATLFKYTYLVVLNDCLENNFWVIIGVILVIYALRSVSPPMSRIGGSGKYILKHESIEDSRLNKG
jgi:hypothetical protein